MALSKALAPSGFSPAAAAVLMLLGLFTLNGQLPTASADPNAQLGRRMLQVRTSDPFSLTFAGVPETSVQVGFQATVTVTIKNTGTQPSTLPDKTIALEHSVFDSRSWTITDPSSTDPNLLFYVDPISSTIVARYFLSYSQSFYFDAGASTSFTFRLTAVKVGPPADARANALTGKGVNEVPVRLFLPFVNDGGVPPPTLPPLEDQGVCGKGPAFDFPTRCYFNNDPQGRYVCCDTQGCDGFNPPANLVIHCKNNGYIPPNNGVPPSTGGLATGGPGPSKTTVPASTPCPSVGGVPTNSCFNSAGSEHVCCVNPDSCGPFGANGEATCANGQYHVFS